MVKGCRPDHLAPSHSQLLGKFLLRESQASRSPVLVDDLQVPHFTTENVLEQEPSNGQGRPLFPSLRAEVFGLLTHDKEPGQADPRRQGTQVDVPPTGLWISERPLAEALIVEIDSAEQMVRFHLQTREDEADLLLRDVMAAIRSGHQ